ncbi:hypothetical protein P3339_01150 [Microbulbifer sp. MLAF003]|uniref:bestrophin-like domain n=1 Tax=Microbulbifer sp. MLAF003 TaxID=3032582 RepID=UPI0024AE07D3|nr:hypothetical protein [Microbulbifer sp. MLAF003]WHI51470.1 hypothetical protein P3339_01150 [Microbulbifer sp. MLAF003]
MHSGNIFYLLPLPLIYLITVALVLCALALGVFWGHRRQRRESVAGESSIGSAVAATLGLVAFVLAFTFNMTADRFNERKALLLQEVNTILAAYLNADFLEKTKRERARGLLAEYVDLRDFDPSTPVSSADIKRSEEIQRQLWQLVQSHIAQAYNADYLRQFSDPVNTLMDLHRARVVVGLQYRIPAPLWLALYFMTILAMLAIGYQLGISRGGSVQVVLALALTFATVILLIADLDRANQGVLLVDQAPMSDLNQRLKALRQRESQAPTER